jgi:hypothetical protein
MLRKAAAKMRQLLKLWAAIGAPSALLLLSAIAAILIV